MEREENRKMETLKSMEFAHITNMDGVTSGEEIVSAMCEAAVV